MGQLYIALAAFAGGLAVALAGWLESGEPFNPRKFGASVIRSLFAGVVFAIGYPVADGVTLVDLFYAFLGGAGADALGNRLSARWLGRGSFPL